MSFSWFYEIVINMHDWAEGPRDDVDSWVLSF